MLPASPPVGRSRLRDPLHVAPLVVAVATIAIVGVSGVRGADYPAHLLRAELWERAGVSFWNFHWYGGHPTPGYSLIVPPLVATLGAFTSTAVASVIATWSFSRLVLSRWRGRWAVVALVAFALGCTVNVMVGRVPFAVGLALAVASVDAWWHRRIRLAVALAVLVPLASPVAAAFLAIAATAVFLDATPWRAWTRRCSESVAVGAAAALPLATLTFAYRSDGWFPFRGDQAVFSMSLMIVLAVLTRERLVRIGAVLAAVVTVVVFLVPNPLGGNYLRLTQFVVIPLALVAFGTAARQRRRAFSLLAAVAIGWSLQFGVVTAVAWQGDASTEVDYHQPLVDEVRARNADGEPVGRLEIPFTENHWEAYFVAAEVPFARGWERQLDLELNAVLYDEHLTVEQYLVWLEQNAVRWIAIPDVDLDEGGNPEAALIRSGAVDPWIDPVWSNRDWVLYEVIDHQPIIDQPAVLEAELADRIIVSTSGPSTVTLRYRAVDGVQIAPLGCVTVGDDGWMRLTLPAAGTYTVGVDVATILPGDPDLSCAE